MDSSPEKRSEAKRSEEREAGEAGEGETVISPVFGAVCPLFCTIG